MLSNQAKIESLLFVSGNEGITARELSQLTGIMKPAVLEQLALIEKKYKQDANTALKLIHAEERYRLVTKKAVTELVKQYFESPAMTELSSAALETLAVVAYKQPVTRIQIDEIRGSAIKWNVTKVVGVRSDQRSWTDGCSWASDHVCNDGKFP